jgi:hypothetical protein
MSVRFERDLDGGLIVTDENGYVVTLSDEDLGDAIAQEILDAWLDALRDCYMLAKGERSGELRGRRVKLLDDRGLHLYSLAWGRALACEHLLPALQRARLSDPAADPVSLRRMAQRDAERAFYDEVRSGADPWKR